MTALMLWCGGLYLITIPAGIPILALSLCLYGKAWQLTLEPSGRDQAVREQREERRQAGPRRIGGDVRHLEQTATSGHWRREAEYTLPDGWLINGCDVLQRYADAALQAGNLSRATLLATNCNGQTPPDNERTREWHRTLKALFLDAGWADPAGGGGAAPNEAGWNVLRDVAWRGDRALVAHARRRIDDSIRPTPTRAPNAPNAPTSGPTDAPRTGRA